MDLDVENLFRFRIRLMRPSNLDIFGLPSLFLSSKHVSPLRNFDNQQYIVLLLGHLLSNAFLIKFIVSEDEKLLRKHAKITFLNELFIVAMIIKNISSKSQTPETFVPPYTKEILKSFFLISTIKWMIEKK